MSFVTHKKTAAGKLGAADDGTNARLPHNGLYSLFWESTRSSGQQVTNEGIVRKVPTQNGRTHHFYAMSGLLILQY